MNRILLLRACEFAKQAVATKTSLPILECLHLKGDGKRLRVTGANGDFYARMEVEGDLKADFCASAGRLKTILSNATVDDVTLEQDGDVVSICGNGTSKIKVLPGADFPEMTKVKGDRFVIPAAAITKVMPAASTDGGRYVLMSVYFDPSGYVVAADGHRFHCVKAEMPKTPTIIPVNVAKILAFLEGEMRINGTLFIATGDGCEIGGKLIEGAYPNWKMGMPNGSRNMIPVTEEFEGALRRCMLCTERHDLSVDVSPSRMSTDGHEEPIEAGLSSFRVKSSYVLEAIASAGTGATIGLGGETSVAVENGDFLAAVFMMRGEKK